MKTTHYLTATVQKGNRLEINLPELSEGQNVEVILIVPNNKFINNSEQDFTESANHQDNIMNKSLTERRKLMAKQAEGMQQHYEEDKSWQEWEKIDIGEIYDY
jgi:hypothetical protein